MLSRRPHARAAIASLCVFTFFAGACSSEPSNLDSAETPDKVISRSFEELGSPLGNQVSLIALSNRVDALTRTSERSVGSQGWSVARIHCAQHLDLFGYDVEEIPIEGSPYVNVVGKRRGFRSPEVQVILSAHMDGVAGCDGADDNASGLAAVLEAAKLLVKVRRHANTLVVACWDGQEQGRVGSLHYAASQRELGATIKAAFVLDMIGYKASEPDSQRLPGTPDDEALFADLFPEAYDDYVAHERRGDFIEVLFDAPHSITPPGGLDAANAFVFAASKNDLRTSALPLKKSFAELFPDTVRSDHASFWENGYSAVLLTDTGDRRNPNYHCQNYSDDSTDSLDMRFATQVTRATVSALVHALEQ